MRPARFVAQMAGQHTPGGKHGGRGRNDDTPDTEFARDLNRMQAGRPAETQKRKTPWIDTAAQGHQADAIRHFQIDHAVNSGRGLQTREAKRVRQSVDRGLRCGRVERTLPAHERSRVEIAENDVCVGNGRSRPAIAVAGWTRYRARTFGADAK